MEDELHVLIVGNPFEGFKIIGPFASFDEADEYALKHAVGENWVSELEAPK
jgi:hypothetical protein